MTIYEKLFAAAKAKGISECEINISKSSSLSIELYHHEIEKYNANTDSDVTIRGIYNGKFGTVTGCSITKDNIDTIVDDLISNARVIEKDEVAELFHGSEKYHKVSTYNKDYEKVTIEQKKADLFALEKALEEADPRVIDVFNVGFEDSVSENMILNSNGMKLKQKSNYFFIVGGALLKDGDDAQDNYEMLLDNDYSKVDIKKLANKIIKGAAEKLHGVPCESKKMKTVLDSDCVATLINVLVSHTVAEKVQKHTSLLEGKLNEKIASKKVTIVDAPLKRTVYARWFDDEGVATYNKDIVKNGVLKTYLYNTLTAKKDGVESTGNGANAGNKISTSTFLLELKPGRKSLEELFESIGNGIYITSLAGAHAGINGASGDFSLQAKGFLIENGKKTTPVSMITVAGNILKLFNDVLEVGSDSDTKMGGIITPSVVVKSLSISGK